MKSENLEGVMDFMNNIKIIGLGPGHKDYILPIAQNLIKESQIIISGKRNIENIQDWVEGKEIYYIDRYLDKMIEFIERNSKKNIVIVVSGDTGFYSLLSYIKENLDEKVEVITGISSVQYMFSKMGDVWNDAFISSVHGRELDLASIINEYDKIGLLTDSKYTPQRIAEIIFQNSLENVEITVGENLSYENESIRTYEVEELMKEKKKFDINVVVIRKIGN